MVAEPGRVADVQAICAKWELDADADRRVTDDGSSGYAHDGDRRRRHSRDEAGGRLPHLRPRGDGERRGACDVATHRPASRRPPIRVGALELPARSPGIASKRWVYEQYDSTVQASHRAGARRRRGRAPIARHRLGHRRHGRLQRPLRRSGPVRGWQARPWPRPRATSRARVPSARHHRLPQFRQPREARGLLPVQGSMAGMPRPAGRSTRRSPAATCRSTTRARRAPSIPRRPSAWSACSSACDRISESLRRAGRRSLPPRRHRRGARRLGVLAEIRGFIGRGAGTGRLDAELRLQRSCSVHPHGSYVGARLLRGRSAVTLAEAAIGDAYAADWATASRAISRCGDSSALPPMRCSSARTRRAWSCRRPDGRAVVVASPVRTVPGVPCSLAGKPGKARAPARRGGTGQSLAVERPGTRKIYFEAIPRRMRHPDVVSDAEGA